MFKIEMKTLIKFAMEKDIEGMETKKGYNGAPILRISSQNQRDILQIQKWCKNLGYGTNLVDRNNPTDPSAFQKHGYDLFCVFGKDTKDLDYFELMEH